MDENITLLERRVKEVLERLRHVTEERRTLEEELVGLRSRLKRSGGKSWEARARSTAETIAEAIRELRASGPLS